jgi:hypothetical protein
VVAHARLGQQLLSERERATGITGQKHVAGVLGARPEVVRHGAGRYLGVPRAASGGRLVGMDVRFRINHLPDHDTGPEPAQPQPQIEG